MRPHRRRPLIRSGRGTHRDSAMISAGVVKSGVLGALATATIAVPIAGAAASPIAATGVLPAAVAETPSAQLLESAAGTDALVAEAAGTDAVSPAPSAPVALPVAETTAAPAFAGLDAGAPTVQIQPTVETADGGEEVTAPDASGTGYMKPVEAPITSDFGWRIHPTLGYSKLHDGVDFGAACGSPVHAAQAGTVIAVETTEASGNRVLIQHADGITTGYFHLEAFRTTVGAQVAKGDVVGLVGSTGRSTGCHLHFSEIDASGTYLDPMSLLAE